MTRFSRVLGIAAALLLVCASAWAPARAADYEAQMDPAPFDATSRADIIGSIGQVSCSDRGLNGSACGKCWPPTILGNFLIIGKEFSQCLYGWVVNWLDRCFCSSSIGKGRDFLNSAID